MTIVKFHRENGFKLRVIAISQLLCIFAMARRIASWLILIAVTANPLAAQTLAARRNDVIVTVRFRPGRPVHTFLPSHALGAAVDGHDQGDTERQLTPANIQAMLSAGFKSLTYRLRTELASDAWHWNPRGVWSEPEDKQGYWTSDSKSDDPILVSYGYKLPRRGNTVDQADNEGYSRLDDGDTMSYWKSNPYLDQYFTGEPNIRHPQWIVIDLGSPKEVDAIRLFWGTPFATRYEIQHANFDDISDISFNPPGMWETFPRGKVVDHAGGEVLIKLSAVPIRARFIRILMTEASGRATASATDVRDRLGYAMREVCLGIAGRNGGLRGVPKRADRLGCWLHDEIRHAADHDKQTVFYVSSTDPWHREIDLDEGAEQPGFDRIFQSGLTNGLPMLTPTGLLYDTPENAAAEIQYLQAQGYPVERVELGEEPDGQYVTPEDYGALYLQFADALHKVAPQLQLGGPSFQEILPDQTKRAVKLGNSGWLRRFLQYLETHDHSRDYSFFSFEWYPFDDVCDPVPPQLARATGMMSGALKDMARRGLSRKIPWIISEYGYSAFASRAEIGIEGALLNADIVGNFLTLGGDQAFLYGYTPGQIARDRDCTAGNNMLFSMNSDGDITYRFATYFGARLLTQEWVKPSDGWHEIYSLSLNLRHKEGESLLTGYAVYRPDGLWSLLFINKDSKSAYKIHLRFRNEVTGAVTSFADRVDLYQLSSAQYQLTADQDQPYPIRSEPPEHRVLNKDKAKAFALPPYSLTVIRGAGPKPKLKERIKLTGANRSDYFLNISRHRTICSQARYIGANDLLGAFDAEPGNERRPIL